ncbi:MAG: DNA polymerase III subunit delta [Gemmatimonadota bacterium]
MGSQSYDNLRRALQDSDVAPVYYLHGAEDILKEEIARSILDRTLETAWRDFNFDQRDAAQLDPESLDALVNTLPMMAGRRVVLIRGVEAWKKKPSCRAVLLKYLARPSAETVLILIQSAPDRDKDKAGDAVDPEIERASVSVDFKTLAPDRVAKWATLHAERMGIKFEPGAAEHLAVVVHHNMGALRTELEKLSSLTGGASISRDRIGELVGIRHGETPLDWRDLVFSGETARAIRLLGPVLDQPRVTGVSLVSLLGTTLAGVGLARSHFDRRVRGGALVTTITNHLKRNFVYGLGGASREAPSWARWAESWPMPRIREGFEVLLSADQTLKNTRISDDRDVLTDVILYLNVKKLEAA